jgi:hypothetical protein
MAGALPPKKRGVKFGPKPKLAAHQAREAARMVREEGKSLRERTTITSAIRRSFVLSSGRREADGRQHSAPVGQGIEQPHTSVTKSNEKSKQIKAWHENQ